MVLAEVKIPPFTKGKKQLEKVDVGWSRELSSVRIHVEQIIGTLKQKYIYLYLYLLIHVVPVVPVMIRMLFASQHGGVVTVATLHDVITHTLLAVTRAILSQYIIYSYKIYTVWQC